MSFNRTALVLFLILILSPFSTPAFAISEEEKSFLLMYFKEEEIQVISATRSLKSISRVAENVEVVTKEDIELMNAHTLGDVLNTVNGVQVSFGGTSPGSSGTALQIQGSGFEHVLVLVDGVRVNDIAGGVADASLIPVQMIEKVEVIKGPASSVWGSSLGGIVNIITKTPGGDGTHGMISGAYGERNTGDFRAEVNGKNKGIGYYLYVGRLQTDGFAPREASSRNSLYAKFSYDFSKDTIATFNILYNKAENESGDFEAFGFRVDTKDELVLSSLSLKSRLSDAVSIDVSARASQKLSSGTITDIIAGTVAPSDTHDNKYGASAKLDYRQGIHSLVFGVDYDLYRTKATFLGENRFDEHIAAGYLNDTIALGKLSIIPGLRFDSVDVDGTSLKENALSPSLGITCEIARKTVIRGVVARGFNIPAVAALFADSTFFVRNPDLKLEKVWSYQIGVETGALNYFWVKASGFRHDIRDAITREDVSAADGTWTLVNKARARRQGVEAELRTLPVYNFTLSAAASYISTKDRETGETIRGNPEYTYDIGLQYDDKKSFRALVNGRYIWWNSPEDVNAKYSSFIFDVNAIKTLYKSTCYAADAFLTVHNLFDGSQYWIENYKNAGRWIEAGLRVKF
jgi:vitamin B12 transporter